MRRRHVVDALDQLQGFAIVQLVHTPLLRGVVLHRQTYTHEFRVVLDGGIVIDVEEDSCLEKEILKHSPSCWELITA